MLDASADAIQIVALADVDGGPTSGIRQKAVLNNLALVIADSNERTSLCFL